MKRLTKRILATFLIMWSLPQVSAGATDYIYSTDDLNLFQDAQLTQSQFDNEQSEDDKMWAFRLSDIEGDDESVLKLYLNMNGEQNMDALARQLNRIEPSTHRPAPTFGVRFNTEF